MPHLLYLDTYFQRQFIVLDGDRAAYKGTDWNAARAAYHELTGTWVHEPTADAARMFAALEGIISDA